MIAVEVAVQEFFVTCEAAGLSPETIKWYRSVLRPFAAQFPDRAVNQIHAADLERYWAELRGSAVRYAGLPQERKGKLSTETIKGRMRGARRFFKWCQKRGYIDRDPTLEVRAPRRTQPEPKATTTDSLLRLLEATDQTAMGKRDRAMIMFMADTGCRAGGLLGLDMDHLDLTHRRALIREKGDKPRTVFFGPYTAEFLRQWLAARPSHATTVFCSLKAHVVGQQMTVSGLNQMLRRLKRKAGITGRCNPHSIRHWFAIAYLKRGGNLSTLRRLLGHSDVKVTDDYYATFDDRELAHAHAMYSPVNDWGGRKQQIPMDTTDAQKFVEMLFWLTEHFPNQPIALIGDGQQIKVGVMSLHNPHNHDWHLEPVSIEQVRSGELCLTDPK